MQIIMNNLDLLRILRISVISGHKLTVI